MARPLLGAIIIIKSKYSLLIVKPKTVHMFGHIMFHFHFDLEGVDEAPFPEAVPPTDEAHDVASTPQQNGEPFTEIDLDSMVRTPYSLHPCMHPHSHGYGSSLAGSIADPNILLVHLCSVTQS